MQTVGQIADTRGFKPCPVQRLVFPERPALPQVCPPVSDLPPVPAAVSTASKPSLLVVFLVVFIDLLGFGIVLPVLPRYGKYFDTSELMLILLMSSFSAMQFLFAPLWGRLSDRVGRRPVLRSEERRVGKEC